MKCMQMCHTSFNALEITTKWPNLLLLLFSQSWSRGLRGGAAPTNPAATQRGWQGRHDAIVDGLLLWKPGSRQSPAEDGSWYH